MNTQLLVIVETEAEAETARKAGAEPILAARIGVDDLFRWTTITAEAGDAAKGREGTSAPVIVELGSGPLFTAHSIVELARVGQGLRDGGLSFGFAGAFELPDIPRLLALRPNWLVLRHGLGNRDAALPDVLALCTPAPRADPHPRPDRVFVRDLVAEIEIGAYRSEEGRRQRVRFGVEVEVAPADPARGFAAIYSYDLVMDAVRLLCARSREAFVETLAERLAADLLQDARVQAVLVRVEKLDLGPGAAGIEIRRTPA